MTADNKWVAAANYNTGSVIVFGVNPDGSLKPDAQVVQHAGHGLLQRQAGPHAHSSVFSPQEDYLLVPDLGHDKIMIYPFNKQAASQPLGTATYAASAPGTGPRHLVPNKTSAYNMEEISGTVSFYRYDHGKLDFVQRIASHPEGYAGEIGSADSHLSPDGKFLYGSNRGNENTITIFAVDPGTGRLTVRGYQSTLGRKPRNFMIDPTGHFYAGRQPEYGQYHRIRPGCNHRSADAHRDGAAYSQSFLFENVVNYFLFRLISGPAAKAISKPGTRPNPSMVMFN